MTTLMYLCGRAHMYPALVRVSACHPIFLPPYGSWDQDQAIGLARAAPLPVEGSRQPKT